MVFSFVIASVRAPVRRDRTLTQVPFHPFFLAAWPVIRLYGDNASEFSLADIMLPLTFAVGLAVGLVFPLTLLSRDPRRAAIFASAFIVPFLTFGLIVTAAIQMWPHETVLRAQLLVFLAWLGLLLVAAYAATKLRRRLGDVTEALNLATLILVLIALVPVASHQLSVRSADTPTSRVAGNFTQSRAQSAALPSRDIYHIVLDRYGSEDALMVGRGIDNSDYVQSLRERGFQVVDDSHANFERTVLSLAATFSMSLLDEVVDSMGTDSQSWGPLFDIVTASPVGSALQDLGYRYVHVGSWFLQTATSDTADEVVRPVNLVDLQSVLFEQSVLAALDSIVSSKERLAHTTLTQLERLHELAGRQDGRMYVFAHVLLPHDPYLFLADGSFAPEAASFATQLDFANAELDRLFDRLLDAPPEEQPILIIQADEGPYPEGYRPEQEDFDWANAADEALVTKFGVLNAMYLPGPEGTRPLPEGMTLVNTYPEVLRRYFGIDVERAPDRIYVSTDRRPYDRVDITDRVLGAERDLGLEGE